MAEPRHHAPGNHAPALFRQLPRGNPSLPLWGTVRHGQCQPRGTVPPTPVRLTRRALEGGPATPSNPSLMNLQGQTMTSGRRDASPATGGPVRPPPCLQHHAGHCYNNSALLGARGRDAATPATISRTDHRQWFPRARLRTPRPTTTPSPSKPPLFQYGTRRNNKTVARTVRTAANSAALHAILLHVAKQCGMLVMHPLLGL
jgi:hypothetical protein